MINEFTIDDPPQRSPRNTIGEAWAGLLRDPGQFIRHWNYKGAILSGVLRAPIFLITYLVSRESIKLAIGAAALQFTFRFIFAGLSGAMIQSFRRVEPAWKALASILLVVPLISHLFEFLLQSAFVYFTATADHTDKAVVRSICVSVFSALFALFIMRRNVMIVGEAESKSLISDVIRIPFMIIQFLSFVPNEISSMIRRGAHIAAALSVVLFGLFCQTVCWAVTSRAEWTYRNGMEVPFLKYWGFDAVVLLILAVMLSSAVFHLQRKHV